MNAELHGRGPEHMGHRLLDRLRELVAALDAYVQLLATARTLVNSTVLDLSLSSQQARRRSYREELAAHLPRETSGNGRRPTPPSADDARSGLGEEAEHLRLTARTKLSGDESAAVRAELHRHDEHLLERYRQLSEEVSEPTLVGILNRHHTAIQEWSQRLRSKTHA